LSSSFFRVAAAGILVVAGLVPAIAAATGIAAAAQEGRDDLTATKQTTSLIFFSV